MTLANRTIALASTLLGCLAAYAPAEADTVKLEIQSAWPLTMPASGTNAELLGKGRDLPALPKLREPR